VRFWNNDVLTNLDGVAVRLLEIIDKNTPHPASQPRAAAKPPSPTRGEGKKRPRAATTPSPIRREETSHPLPQGERGTGAGGRA
jgi:hypothetical protein